MTLGLPGHASPSAGFDAPLDMLAACHERLHRQCATLRRLVDHLPRHGSDEQAREAATGVMRYFDTSARHHHADEEADLFPALLESMAGSDAVCLRELADSLRAEHRELERCWLHLRTTLACIARGEPAVLDSADVESLVGRYERHIAREEAELLPLAARLLGDDAIAALGRAMRARRGIPDPA